MRKVAVNNNMLFWSTLFFVSSFPFFAHAGSVDLKTHGYDDEAIIQTFLIHGEVYDCIDIYKQPGLKHPLLINHTIQMEPTIHPERTKHPETNGVDKFPVGEAEPWSLPESCPEGSVPVRRLQRMNNSLEVDLHMRRRYFLRRNGTIDDQKYDSREHEHCAVQINGDKYLASTAGISVCGPKIEMGLEFSVAQMWVHSMDGKISLEAGWTVYPNLYGDPRTRFFTLWTTNGYDTYCFNNQCPGYIHTNRETLPDAYLSPISVVGGPQYSINVQIFQDPATKHWWVGLAGKTMGYWPQEVVPSFRSGAEGVQFGGEVLNKRTNGRHTATEMGLGHFSSEGLGKAGFFRNVQIVTTGSPAVFQNPVNPHPVSEFPGCYDLQLGSDSKGAWGFNFFFGGPGRSNTCP